MSKTAGSLPRGRRRPEEVPDVPQSSELTESEQKWQRLLQTLVEESGGRLGLKGPQIPVEHVDEFAELFSTWARHHMDSGDEYFNGRPGLWHALDELYPLQDPNRWDRLRAAVLLELEGHRGWTRSSMPKGSGWILPDQS